MKMKIMKKKYMRKCALLIVVCLLTGVLSASVTAGGIAINDPDCSGWMGVVPYDDPAGDQQTGSGSVSQDIVGSDEHPAAFLRFSDDGSEIAVRIRVNNCDGTPNDPQFKNFGFIGIDATGNGAIDFFLGVYNPTGSNGRLGVYLADPSLPNTGPGNTGVTKPIASFQPRAGESFSFIAAEYDQSDPVYPGFSGDPDYFLTFLFSLADINKAISNTGITLTPGTPFTYIIGTATQDNSLNGDISGIGGLNGGKWDFPSPTSTDGTEYHTVTFDKNGGDTEASPKAMSFVHGALIEAFPSPPARRGGWRFTGWSTDPDDDETLAHEFTPGTQINQNMTVYAIWTPQLTETLGEEDVVHFDPVGGSWSGSPANYRDAVSEDGIIRNLPPPPDVAPGPAPGGNSTRIFGGWTTSPDNGPNHNNIITISGNTNAGEVGFYIWSKEISLLTKTYQTHSGSDEYTVYALWLDVPKNTDKISFYDNIPVESPAAPNGRLIYDTYLGNNGTPAYTPKPPTRQGYVFRGWDTNPNGTGTRYQDPFGSGLPLISTKFTDGQVLYAIWEPTKYALQFNPNTVDLSRDRLIGSPQGTFDARLCDDSDGSLRYPAFPDPPTLPGYTFLEWNTDPNGFGYTISPEGIGDIICAGGELRFSLLEPAPPDLINGAAVEGYTKLYAIWERDPTPPFYVTFDAMGGKLQNGTGINQVLIIANEGKVDGVEYIKYAPPRWPDPQTGQDLYVFMGWSYDSGSDRQVDFHHPLEVTFLEEQTVYAVWKPNDVYTVTFVPNNGRWPDGSTQPITVETVNGLVAYIPWSGYYPESPHRYPYREDFIFRDWNTEADCTGYWFDPGFEITRNMVVYAQWQHSDPNYVNITFLLNDGTGDIVPGDYATQQGTPLDTFPTPPVRDGWNFLGWYTEPEGQNEWDCETPFDADTALYAKWEQQVNEIQKARFSFTKVDAEYPALPLPQAVLPGAVFGLYQLNQAEETDDGHEHEQTCSPGSSCWIAAHNEVTSGDNGKVDFGMLEAGEYLLAELEAPGGYRLPAGQWLITVNPEAETEPDVITISCVGGATPPAFIMESDGDSVSYYLPNMKPLVLPFTGGTGTRMFTVLGGVLMTIATAYLIISFLRGKNY